MMDFKIGEGKVAFVLYAIDSVWYWLRPFVWGIENDGEKAEKASASQRNLTIHQSASERNDSTKQWLNKLTPRLNKISGQSLWL